MLFIFLLRLLMWSSDTVHSFSFDGLGLERDGSYSPENLKYEWVNSSCTASGFRDFFVDTSSMDVGQENLFIKAVIRPGPGEKKLVKVNLLSLNLFFDDIPSDRKSEERSDMSSDGVYSLVVGTLMCFDF
jgi:hypothetical protein